MVKQANVNWKCSLLVVVGVLLSFWFFQSTLSPETLKEAEYVSFINEQWELSLPEEGYLVLYAKYPKEMGIQGDGDRFHVFVYDKDIAAPFGAKAHEEMWKYFRERFDEKVTALEVAETYRPPLKDLESGKIYYLNTPNHSELYLIYLDEIYLDHQRYQHVLFALESYL